MKIAICGSLDFTEKMAIVQNEIEACGHEVFMPETAQKILAQELTVQQIQNEKESGQIADRATKNDLIRNHYNKIKEADAILVVNEDKKGIVGYIGGNTFLEIGFAHILGKKIFLMNQIPTMPYTNEIMSMPLTVLNGELRDIK